MTNQITVPRETWDAMREALISCIPALEQYEVKVEREWGCGRSLEELEERGEIPHEIKQAREALAAANAVSADPKVKLIPTAQEMGTPVQPQFVGCAYYESNGKLRRNDRSRNGGKQMTYTKLLNEFPEINPANYGDDEVNALNAWGIAAHIAIEALQKEVSTLDVLLEECKMDWSGDVTQIKAEHKREIEALQAENERLKAERFAELVSAPLRAENEALRADAERWRYSVTIGGNQTMNWLDVYDDWDGDGGFTDQIDAARAREQTP